MGFQVLLDLGEPITPRGGAHPKRDIVEHPEMGVSVQRSSYNDSQLRVVLNSYVINIFPVSLSRMFGSLRKVILSAVWAFFGGKWFSHRQAH